jgi:hypothetical protein
MTRQLVFDEPSPTAMARRLRSLPGVDDWPPERAEEWWETNLPDFGVVPPGRARSEFS